MDLIISFFNVAGYVSTGIVIVTSVAAIQAWIKGILPVMLRLGNGLAKRKIALFAKPNDSESLKALLTDSGIFDAKNIISVMSINDIGKAEQATLFLVYWPDWSAEIDKILQKKTDGTALIVYSPISNGPLPNDISSKINSHRNSILTNFRGRLLNDIVASMITTSYKR